MPSGAGPPIDRRATTLRDWSPRYLELVRPLVGVQTYREAIVPQVRALELALGGRALSSFRAGEARILVPEISAHLDPHKAATQVAPATIANRLRRLRDMLRVAYVKGELERPSRFLDEPIPRDLARKTHARKRAQAPLSAAELERLIAVLAAPGSRLERVGFPLCELALVTGLRFGELAALHWARSFPTAERVFVGESWNKSERRRKATKTGNTWSIIRTRGADRALSRVAPETRLAAGFVFSVTAGETPIEYKQWRRTFVAALSRAKISHRPGLSQKLFRKSFVTAAGVCGVPLKLIAAQYGHATVEMVQREYDLHVDPDAWPSERERRVLADVFGFEELLAARGALGR